MSKIKCLMSNIKCQISIKLNFCRSVPLELLQSFFISIAMYTSASGRVKCSQTVEALLAERNPLWCNQYDPAVLVLSCPQCVVARLGELDKREAVRRQSQNIFTTICSKIFKWGHQIVKHCGNGGCHNEHKFNQKDCSGVR